jgi:hypothetical protein
MINRYSTEASRTILNKLSSKGWNAYCSTHTAARGHDAVIRTGPAQELKLDERYVLLPIATQPTNPAVVMAALDAFAIRHHRQPPTIAVYGETSPWTGFILYADHVKVNAPESWVVPYETFIESLDSIVAAQE